MLLLFCTMIQTLLCTTTASLMRCIGLIYVKKSGCCVIANKDPETCKYFILP